VSQAELAAKVAERLSKKQAAGASPNLYPNKQMRERDTKAKQLHGRLVLQSFVDRATGQRKPFWGRVHFVSEQRRPRYFDIHFEDGDIYDYTVADVQKHVQPARTVLPAGVTLPNDEAFTAKPAAKGAKGGPYGLLLLLLLLLLSRQQHGRPGANCVLLTPARAHSGRATGPQLRCS
jgi:hypothetical protein